MQPRVIEEVEEEALSRTVGGLIHVARGIVCQVRTLFTTTVILFSAPGSTTSVTSASNGV